MLYMQVFWCFLLHVLDCKLHKFRVGNMFSGTLYFFILLSHDHGIRKVIPMVVIFSVSQSFCA